MLLKALTQSFNMSVAALDASDDTHRKPDKQTECDMTTIVMTGLMNDSSDDDSIDVVIGSAYAGSGYPVHHFRCQGYICWNCRSNAKIDVWSCDHKYKCPECYGGECGNLMCPCALEEISRAMAKQFNTSTGDSTDSSEWIHCDWHDDHDYHHHPDTQEYYYDDEGYCYDCEGYYGSGPEANDDSFYSKSGHGKGKGTGDGCTICRPTRHGDVYCGGKGKGKRKGRHPGKGKHPFGHGKGNYKVQGKGKGKHSWNRSYKGDHGKEYGENPRSYLLFDDEYFAGTASSSQHDALQSASGAVEASSSSATDTMTRSVFDRPSSISQVTITDDDDPDSGRPPGNRGTIQKARQAIGQTARDGSATKIGTLYPRQ